MPIEFHVEYLQSYDEKGSNIEEFIEKLDFSNQDLDENKLGIILNAIKNEDSSHVKEISFRECGITDELISSISFYDIFDKNLLPSLEKLDLSTNLISEKGFKELLYIKDLGRNDKLKVILRGNNVENPHDVIKRRKEKVKKDQGKILPDWDFTIEEKVIWSDCEGEKVIWSDCEGEVTTNKVAPISATKAFGMETIFRALNLR